MLTTGLATQRLKEARAQGFTQPITLEGGTMVLDLLIQPDTDLDSAFRAFCLDECEFIRVSGWLWTTVESEE